jgi:hypothetical protein
MAQMGITDVAASLYAHHSEGGVFMVSDGVFNNWLGEARPACSGLKFDAGIEQGGVAACTPVNPWFMGRTKFT